MAERALPSLSEYPIPRDVAPGPGWSARMLEMAEHIGPYETLLIVDRFGGQDVYVPADADKSPFAELIGREKAAALSWAYRRERLAVPTAPYALARARRAAIIAAVRANKLTVSDAARIMGVRRDYASKLINRTDEGQGVVPARFLPKPRDPRQLDMFSGRAG